MIKPYSPFWRFTLVFRSSFLRLRSFEGESSTSASSCDVLEAIFSTPSGRALILFRIFFRKCARLSFFDLLCPCHLGFVGEILIGIPEINYGNITPNIPNQNFMLNIPSSSVSVLLPSQWTPSMSCFLASLHGGSVLSTTMCPASSSSISTPSSSLSLLWLSDCAELSP